MTMVRVRMHAHLELIGGQQGIGPQVQACPFDEQGPMLGISESQLHVILRGPDVAGAKCLEEKRPCLFYALDVHVVNIQNKRSGELVTGEGWGVTCMTTGLSIRKSLDRLYNQFSGMAATREATRDHASISINLPTNHCGCLQIRTMSL